MSTLSFGVALSLSTTPYEREQIRQVLAETCARRVLEVGSWKGETTAVLSALIPTDGLVVAIDPMCWRSEVLSYGIKRHLGPTLMRMFARIESRLPALSYECAFWESVRRSGRENVVLFRSLSTDPELLRSTDPRLQSFDVAFIDGDHSYPVARSDLERWGGRVRPGGRLLVHDATPRFDGVRRAVGDWARERNVRISWPTRGSLCVLEIGLDQGSHRTEGSAPSPTTG